MGSKGSSPTKTTFTSPAQGGGKKASPNKKQSPNKKATKGHLNEAGLPTIEITLPTNVAVDEAMAGVIGIQCKHLSAMTEFLKMYHLAARHIHWSGELKACCSNCRTIKTPMLVCLQCPYFGCWSGEVNHLQGHTGKCGHALAIELVSGCIYCAVCKCWVWSDLLEAVWKEARTTYSSNSPTIKMLETVNELCDAISNKTCAMVRGLYNLGNTCFMNSVLQVLVHTIPLRKYFLAPMKPHECKRDPCVACEIDTLFCRMFDGKSVPLAPAQFLMALWKSSKDMAGYDQQDAHELFVTLRNSLHQCLGGQSYNCSCITHQLFAGVLQSDLTCGACGKVAETLDPFLDISLDLPVSFVPIELEACLQMFTRTENLLAGSFICSTCHRSEAEIEKKLTIRNNPKILAIHLKRFDGASKLDTVINFSSKLSLSPYLSDPTIRADYELYAVINHVGSLDSGHYTVHIKCRNEWFGIDDACVTACGEASVYNANAYMLFYTLCR